MDKIPNERALAPIEIPYRKKKEQQGSPAISGGIVHDANQEAIRWVGDIAYEVDYAPWAVKGMTVQNFMRTRQLAVQDAFEDITEETKKMAYARTFDPRQVESGLAIATLDEVRAQKEYFEIKAALVEAAEKLSKPQEAEKWIKERAGSQARRHIERAMRDPNEDTRRDVVRTAQTVIEIETPKASRVQTRNKGIQFPEEAAKTVAAALADAGITVIGDGDSDD